MSGHLALIVGPMFSGKTTRLLEVLEQAEEQGLDTLAVKPRTDDRYDDTSIVSHNGRRSPALPISSAEELANAASTAAAIVVDEGQFLPPPAVNVLIGLVERPATVTVAALDLDFRGDRFPVTAALARHASSIEKLQSTCGICGNPATYTQRLTGTGIAPLDGPTVLVGGADAYQPRCERCFRAERSR